MRLARRIVRCKEPRGLDRAAVRRILGPPADGGRGFMEYYLAPEPGEFPIDAQYLFVDIADGRVTSYYVAQG